MQWQSLPSLCCPAFLSGWAMLVIFKKTSKTGLEIGKAFLQWGKKKQAEIMPVFPERPTHFLIPSLQACRQGFLRQEREPVNPKAVLTVRRDCNTDKTKKYRAYIYFSKSIEHILKRIMKWLASWGILEKSIWWRTGQGCYEWDSRDQRGPALFDIFTSNVEANIKILLVMFAERQTGGKLKSDQCRSVTRSLPCFCREAPCVVTVMPFEN